MPKNIVTGVVLAAAGAALVLVGAALDLEIEPVALVGVALGAAVSLVPDRSPTIRLVGFAGGFVAAWIGFVVRAAALPDASSGRAVALAVVVLLCVGVTVVSWGRVPLWAPLLGVVPMAGSYEATFSAAPPEVLSTSMTAATSLLLTLAVGFLVAAVATPPLATADEGGARRRRTTRTDDADLTPLATMMEKQK